MTTITKTEKNIVETELGKIQGYSHEGLQIFKGIPYAASPVGELRFSPPAPREVWSDVLDCTTFGPYVIQSPSVLDMFLGKPKPQSEEDCLTLNIWTPKTDDANRPVMFWIHGGGFMNGGGPLPLYRGSSLARRGNVVVVNINYRLGVLGYSYIPGVTANIGMLDQIAALEWVNKNIESFGGDPNNITIFGESAGAMSVSTLIAMPAAKGLFNRVIAQSGAAHPLIYNPELAKKSTDRLMSELGLEADDIEKLRKLPVKEIIKAQNKITMSPNLAEFLPFSPRIDKETLPKHPLEAVSEGSAKDYELLIGTNADEIKLFSALDPNLSNMDEKGLYKFIKNIMDMFGENGTKVKHLLETYKEARKGKLSIKPSEILAAIGTDFTFRIPTIRMLEIYSKHQEKVYNYLFNWPSPALNGRFGSCHAVEIAFVLGTIDLPKMDIFFGKGADAKTLCERTMDAWLNFAKSGDPNHKNIPKWPVYDQDKRATMIIDKEFKVVNGYRDKERSAWDDIF